MFRDHRTAGAWLPKTMYTTRFQESGYRALAEFDGDVDLTTGTGAGVTLAGEHLSTWNENAVPFRGRGTDTQNHNAVWIGWNNEMAPDGRPDGGQAGASDRRPKPAPRPPRRSRTKLGPPASYSISVPDALRSDWGVGERSVVYLSLAATNTKPGPRTPPKRSEEGREKREGRGRRSRRRKPPPNADGAEADAEAEREAGRDADRPHRRARGHRRPRRAAAAQPVRHRAPAARRAHLSPRRPRRGALHEHLRADPADVRDAASRTSSARQPAFDPRQLATIRLLFDAPWPARSSSSTSACRRPTRRSWRRRCADA